MKTLSVIINKFCILLCIFLALALFSCGQQGISQSDTEPTHTDVKPPSSYTVPPVTDKNHYFTDGYDFRFSDDVIEGESEDGSVRFSVSGGTLFVDAATGTPWEKIVDLLRALKPDVQCSVLALSENYKGSADVIVRGDFERVEIAADNPYFVLSENGCIIHSESCRLVYVPTKYNGAELVIPDGVKEASDTVLFRNNVLPRAVRFPEGFVRLRWDSEAGKAVVGVELLSFASDYDVINAPLPLYYEYGNADAARYRYMIIEIRGEKSDAWKDYLAYSENEKGKGEYRIEQNVLYIGENVRSVYELDTEALKNEFFEKIIFPAGFESFYSVYELNAASYEVAKENPNYSSEGGAVYSKEGYWLVAVPQKMIETFSVPESVKRIGVMALGEWNYRAEAK